MKYRPSRPLDSFPFDTWPNNDPDLTLFQAVRASPEKRPGADVIKPYFIVTDDAPSKHCRYCFLISLIFTIFCHFVSEHLSLIWCSRNNVAIIIYDRNDTELYHKHITIVNHTHKSLANIGTIIIYNRSDSGLYYKHITIVNHARNSLA